MECRLKCYTFLLHPRAFPFPFSTEVYFRPLMKLLYTISVPNLFLTVDFLSVSLCKYNSFF